MLKRTHILILTSVIVLFLTKCNSNKSVDKDTASKTCFCDSIFDNTHLDSVKEYLCYKGERVYKLQKSLNGLRLSRHSLNNPSYCFELLKVSYENKFLPDSEQSYISVDKISDKVQLTFKFKTLDSVRLTIENRIDTLVNITNKGNSVIVDKSMLSDTSHYLRMYGYTHGILQHPVTKEFGKATTTHQIHIWAFYLLNSPLGSVLINIQECLEKQYK